MTTPLLSCNADFEMRACALPPPAGPARASMDAVARVFALMGPPGSALESWDGERPVPMDGDDVRARATAEHRYEAGVARDAPWVGAAVTPWAIDDRTAGRGALGSVEVAQRVNRKDFSLRAAQRAGLEPGVFAHAAVVRSVDELAACLDAAPAAFAGAWTVKPVLGFAGQGRVAGGGATPTAGALRAVSEMIQRDGACVLEPWVERTWDASTQLLVSATGAPRVLAQASLLVTAGGRHVGNASLRGGALHHAERLRDAALGAGAWLREEGYFGPAGVDAFAFRDPLDGTEHVRAVVEINARFTLGLAACHVATMARAGDTWTFRFDATLPFGALEVGA